MERRTAVVTGATGGIGSERTFTLGGSASGIGDLIVRVKGSVMHEGHRAFAGGIVLGLIPALGLLFATGA